MDSKKLAWYFVFLLTTVLVVGYIFISFNNRYHYDDLGFFSLVRDKGLWNAFLIMYHSWETTYLTFILFGLLKWVDIVPPIIYNISILLVNIFCLFLLMRTIFHHYHIGMKAGKIILLSALIISLSYFSCRAMGNVTYWVTGQIVYSLFLSTLILGLHFWLKQKLLLASVFMFLFGHTRINYDAIFIGLYFCYFLFFWIENKRVVINWKQQIPFLFFIAGVISYVIVPGNYNRVDAFAVNSPIKHLNAVLIMKGWLSAFVHLGGTVLGSWKQQLVLPIGVILGIGLSEYPSFKKIINVPFLMKCSIAFIVAYIGQATILLIAIKTPVGYGRIFYFLELLLFILILLYGIFLGILMKSFFDERINYLMIYSFSLPVILIAGIHYYNNYQISIVFAKEYDKRIQLLKKIKQQGENKHVYLTPLPDSGVLLYSEIDPQEGTSNKLPDNNAVYVHYYQLPFNIYLAK